jgi:hypothetical protein
MGKKMKMLEGILRGARKIGAGLALAGALAVGPKVDAAINGYTTWGTNSTISVTNNQYFVLPIVTGTASNITSETMRIELGSGNSQTGNVSIAGLTFFENASNVVTNPGSPFYSATLSHALPMLATNALYFQINLGTASGLGTGTGQVANLFLNFYNPTSTNALIDLNFIYTSVGKLPSGTWSTLGGTWTNAASALSGFDTSSHLQFNVAPATIPEPSGFALALWGLGGLFVLNRWKRKD